MKLNVSLADDLVSRIDSFADENYMSRSGLISIAVTQYLNQHEAINAMKSVALSIRKIADGNVVDEDTMKELEDFERISEMFLAAYK